MAFTNTVTLSFVRIWDTAGYSELEQSGLSYLLRRNVVGGSSHVDLLVNIKAGDDEENSRTSGTALYQSPQSEDHGSLILLNNLHAAKVFLGGNGKRGINQLKTIYAKVDFVWLDQLCRQ